MSEAPTVDLAALATDPAPHFARFRASPRWVWAEPMGIWLVSRYDDVVFVDEHPELFSTDIPGALLTRTLGVTMIRQEGRAHHRLRSAPGAALKRTHIAKHWGPRIAELSEQHLSALGDRAEFDLLADFASGFTGSCLADALGLDGVMPADVRRWSDAFIGGLINNTDDPSVWAAAATALAETTEAVTRAVDRVSNRPDSSIISAMVHSRSQPALSTQEIAANVGLMIAGGFNDARDAVATLPWLLMTHPDVADRVRTDEAACERAIDESVRWLSPVGSYPRVLTGEFRSAAASLAAGDKVLVLAASANWDESRFPRPDRFDIDRPNLDAHLGFSVGAHFCLGSQLVRAMLRAAVPRIMALPRIRPTAVPEFRGWQFRGPVSVLVTVDR